MSITLPAQPCSFRPSRYHSTPTICTQSNLVQLGSASLHVGRVPKPFDVCNSLDKTHKKVFCSLKRRNGYVILGKRSLFVVNAEKDNSNGNKEEEEAEAARGQSTMPERFRYLTKEAPDKPVRWPWFIALAFMTYTWRTVLWELYNWKRALAAVLRFLAFISKLVLALLFQFIGDPITSFIRAFETSLYTVRAFYSGVINYAPIPDLTLIVILASVILAISEAAVPDSVNSQPYLLTAAGLVGFIAVRGYITELFFWMLLIGMFGFGRFVKKRDNVSSALPVAAVLAAVGEPWVRTIVIASFLALAVIHYSKKPVDVKDNEAPGIVRKVPFPLLCAALAIGVRVAAKWAGYRHLTWMVV